MGKIKINIEHGKCVQERDMVYFVFSMILPDHQLLPEAAARLDYLLGRGRRGCQCCSTDAVEPALLCWV